jgi:hypothetical protein
MLRWLARPAERCLGRTACGCGGGGSGDGGGGDGLLWHVELKPHASGEYSIAVAQANERLEDQGQVVTSPALTFVGVYDGHGGPEASRFLSSRLFPHLHSECASKINSIYLPNTPMTKLLNCSIVPMIFCLDLAYTWCKFADLDYNSFM